MRKFVLLFLLAPVAALAQTANPPPKPELTEIWSPVPPKVEPGPRLGDPPSDAIILFNGRDLTGWESAKGGPAGWAVENGEMVDVPRPAISAPPRNSAISNCMSNGWFRCCRPDRKGQDRGNSGIYLQGLYEVQVLDSYDNPTYVNGGGGLDLQAIRAIGECAQARPQLQAYDIVYYAPRFYADGTLAEPARVTVFLNGVVVQSNFAIKGPTEYRGMPVYKPHGDAQCCCRRITIRCATGICG